MKQSTCETHDGFIVVYEGWGECPVCNLTKERDQLLSEHDDLEGEIEELKDKISNMQERIDELEFEKECAEDEDDE